MAEDKQADAAPVKVDEPQVDADLVEWFDEDGNRHKGSRFGSAYREFVHRWLAAERTYKAETAAAEDAAKAEAAAAAETPATEAPAGAAEADKAPEAEKPSDPAASVSDQAAAADAANDTGGAPGSQRARFRKG